MRPNGSTTWKPTRVLKNPTPMAPLLCGLNDTAPKGPWLNDLQGSSKKAIHSLNGSMTLWSERCCPQKSKNSEIYKAPLKKRHAPMEPWLGSLKDDAPEGSRLDCLQDFPKSYSPMEPWVDGLKDSNPKGPRLNSLHNFTKKKLHANGTMTQWPANPCPKETIIRQAVELLH